MLVDLVLAALDESFLQSFLLRKKMMPYQPGESGISLNNGVIEGGSPCLCGSEPGHLTDVHWPGDPTAEAFSPGHGCDLIQLSGLQNTPSPQTTPHAYADAHTRMSFLFFTVAVCIQYGQLTSWLTNIALFLKGSVTHCMLSKSLIKEENGVGKKCASLRINVEVPFRYDMKKSLSSWVINWLTNLIIGHLQYQTDSAYIDIFKMNLTFAVCCKRELGFGKKDVFPLSHHLVLHTAPWVDGSVGCPLPTPTAQCAPPHFGLLPSLFAVSPSQICLFFVAFHCR